LYLFHSIYSDTLLKIADCFSFSLFFLHQQILIQYSDNTNNTNSVINLFFLQLNYIKLNSYIIHPKFQFLLDHALLTVNIISREVIQEEYRTIIKNSEDKNKFILDLVKAIGKIKTTTILDKDTLDNIVQDYIRILNSI